MSIIGFLGFIVFLVLFILALIKKKQKRKSAIGMVLCFIIFIAGAISTEPNVSEQVSKADVKIPETSKVETVKEVVKTEIESSELIAYENTLDSGH